MQPHFEIYMKATYGPGWRDLSQSIVSAERTRFERFCEAAEVSVGEQSEAAVLAWPAVANEDGSFRDIGADALPLPEAQRLSCAFADKNAAPDRPLQPVAMPLHALNDSAYWYGHVRPASARAPYPATPPDGDNVSL